MDAEQQVRAYHALSKHAPNAYAPGPGQLDWATQPAPFRRYAGARLIELWQRPLEETPGYDAPFAGSIGAPAPLSRSSISQLLYDSLALSAWKEAGGNRWALRVNPSSGNLHPTEAYLLLPPGSVEAAGLLVHYAPDAHGLEVRAELPAPLGEQLQSAPPAGGFLLGLASIPWREAWKYGERAYRYCQHDLGHALACLSIAAAIQGWQVRLLRGVAEARLDGLLGLDRDGFHEAEHGDCLLWVGPPQAKEFALPETLLRGLAALELIGAPNRLSRQYREWPELARVHGLCRAPALPGLSWQTPSGHNGSENPGLPLRPILHRRRSAQAFDGRSGIQAELLFAWLRRLLPENSPVPFAVTSEPAQVDLLLFVHRVQGLEPGLYWLARCDGQPQPDGLRGDFAWQRVHAELPLYRLLEGDAVSSPAARTSPAMAAWPWPCWRASTRRWPRGHGAIHGCSGSAGRSASCCTWRPRRRGCPAPVSAASSTIRCMNCWNWPTAAGKAFTISPLAAPCGTRDSPARRPILNYVCRRGAMYEPSAG